MLELKKGHEEMSNMLLQTVISICVNDIDGIKTLPPRLLGKFYSMLSRDQLNSAVIHHDIEDNIIIDIFIAVKYNQCIPKKIKELQQLIKEEIEVITGFKVQAVNVYVDGLWLE
ncbi:hypothetical protein AB685_11525 [Bacillus sp. LL01]|uniref:Asp23/Gls24 family envelope stress response protein n=1 Tax=Bacillus sp. LL01 TaxID=1665556 RepID=UPI00064D3AA0|nr:Asp23/Gls24 family envelope stress response protein [Bacillus sp. LL01]KMJ58505.1 hypothetical protein AB685_11525 [Bacillus sp. LL01]